MNNIIEKIMDKKEFRDLPILDVKLIYSLFENRKDLLDEEKIKETRKILVKIYTSFLSSKSFNLRNREEEWFLKKHKSTKERSGHYLELYKNLFRKYKNKEISVFDFGCGLNGFSYSFFSKLNLDVDYIGTEPVGQLVKLQNEWFEDKNFSGKVYHKSLFNLQDNLDLVKSVSGIRIGFFFKVIDSLEFVKRNYSKEVLQKLSPFFDKVVVSWATKSLIRKKKIAANKKWFLDFVKDNFEVLEDFVLSDERYLVFRKK